MISRLALHNLLLPLSIVLLILPSCKRPCYKPQTLNNSKIYALRQTKNNITVHFKQLTKSETNSLFNGRAGRLLRKRKPIYPIFLSIENNSPHPIILDPRNISLKLVDPHIVAFRLHEYTNRRIIGTLLLGMVGATVSFFAAAYITIIGAVAVMPGLIKAGYATLGLCGLFAIGSPIISYRQGVQSNAINRIIDADIQEKSLIGPITVQPGRTRTVLFFAHYTAHNSPFLISFIDAVTGHTISFEHDFKGISS